MTDYFEEELAGDFGADFGADFGDEYGSDDGEEDIFIGIPPTVFGGAGRQVIQCNVTQPFRADRLILDAASQAAGVIIEQISVSSIDQNRGDGQLPGDMFTEDAKHRLSGTIVDPGVGIALTVIAPGAMTFRGMFTGPARSKSQVARSKGSVDGVACGIPLLNVGIGATEQLIMNPTQPFLARKLVLSAASRVAGVTVNQISISSVDQNRAAGIGVAPAEAFAPNSTHSLRGTLVRPGVGARLTVTNNTAGAIDISGAYFGKAHTG